MAQDRSALHRLGWDDEWEQTLAEAVTDHAAQTERQQRPAVARVAVEHRGYYDLFGLGATPTALTTNAAVTSTFRRSADDALSFPSVGDWVLVRPGQGHRGSDAIDRVLPRRSVFVRRAPGRDPRPQSVGANIDHALIVTGLDGDLSERRLERYLAVTHGGGAEPVIVLSKADQIDEAALDVAREAVSRVALGVRSVVTSIVDGRGLDEVRSLGSDGKTVAFVGSSGVGKSSLVNAIFGNDLQEVQATRDDGRGRHTTVRRDLLPLHDGGLLLDTPGMREVQLWDDRGLAATFPVIAAFADRCRFADCAHRDEPGCAVTEAVSAGTLAADRLASFHQLLDEVAVLEDELEDRRRSKGEGRRP